MKLFRQTIAVSRILLLLALTACASAVPVAVPPPTASALPQRTASDPPAPSPTPSPAPPASATPVPATVTAQTVLYRGDEARTGAFAFPAIRRQPSVKWRTELGRFFLATPLIADGVLISGGSNGTVYAVDAETGGVLWSAGGFQQTETTLAIAGDVIVAGGHNRKVQALDRHTGMLLWSFEASAFVHAAPLIVDDEVYIATHLKLHVLDLATGRLLWEGDTGSEEAYTSPPALAGGVVFVASGPAVLAFDRGGGQLLWKAEAGGSFLGLAAAYEQVYVGNTDGYLYAYDQQTGAVRWRFQSAYPAPNAFWSAPAVAEGVVYAGSRDRSVYALDALSGELSWSFEAAGFALGDPVLSGGLVYLSDSNHELPRGPRRLYALDAQTGEEVWSFEVESTILTIPALAPGNIFVTIAGEILALE